MNDNLPQKLFRQYLLHAPQSEFEKLFIGYVPDGIGIKEMYYLLGTLEVDVDEYVFYVIAHLPKIAEKAFSNIDTYKRVLEEKWKKAELKHLIGAVMKEKTSQSVRDLTYFWLESERDFGYEIKNEFNRIAWGIPSDESIKFISKEVKKHFKKNSSARLIDLGAGSGAFSLLLKDAGIPENRIVAIDFERSMCEQNLELFPITKIPCYSHIDPKSEKYQEEHEAGEKRDAEEAVKHIRSDDVILIVWGYYLWKTFDACREMGISTFIVQGEPGEIGCTFPVDYLQNDAGWTTTIVKLPTAYGIYEHVAVWNKKL